MDAEIKAAIDELVLKQEVNAAIARRNFKALQDQIDFMITMVNNHHKLHETYLEADNDLSRELQKMREVYYHVFPDRLEPDVQFEEQLRALNSKPDPDGKKDPA